MTDAGSDKATQEAPLLSTERQAKAREYAYINRRLAVIEAVLAGLALGWLIIGGWGESIVRNFNMAAVPGAVVYFALIYIGYRVLFWPFGYYRGYVLSRRYGLSNQDSGGWISDYLKGSALALALGAGAVAAVYWFIAVQPQLWWLIAWGMMIIISFALSYLAPVVVVPLFFRMKPLAETDIKERLEGLAKKAGVKITGVYTIEFSAKTSAANAALMGTGKTRRIAISDTLLAGFTPEEIEVVVAHELGHQKNGDFARLFAFQAAVLLLCFWLTDIIAAAMAGPLGFSGLGDAAAMPLLVAALLALSVLLTPMLNIFSRNREQAADDFALRLTGQPEAFISMMAKLTDQNLAEAEPGRWTERLFNDHPGYKSRVEHARRYQKP